MAIPPKGDPRRPIALGVKAARGFGVISLVLGVLGLIGAWVGWSRGDNGHLPGFVVFLLVAGVVVLVIAPGVLDLALAGFVKRLKEWAAVVLLVVASLHTLFMAYVLLRVVLASVWDDTPASVWVLVFVGISVPSLLVFAVLGIYVAVSVVLVVSLFTALGAIRRIGEARRPGFEPILSVTAGVRDAPAL